MPVHVLLVATVTAMNRAGVVVASRSILPPLNTVDVDVYLGTLLPPRGVRFVLREVERSYLFFACVLQPLRQRTGTSAL